MARRLALACPLLVVLAAAATARAGASGVEILRHQAKWESGYGAKFYNVVGTLRNTSGHALRWVKLRIDGLDASGKVVATTETYNESAEVLAAPEIDPQKMIASGKVTPIAAGAEQRFRGGFMADEHPDVQGHRVTVVDAPPAP